MILFCVLVMFFFFYGILVVSLLDFGLKSFGVRFGWVIVWYFWERYYFFDRLGLGFFLGGVEVFLVILCYMKLDMFW